MRLQFYRFSKGVIDPHADLWSEFKCIKFHLQHAWNACILASVQGAKTECFMIFVLPYHREIGVEKQQCLQIRYSMLFLCGEAQVTYMHWCICGVKITQMKGPCEMLWKMHAKHSWFYGTYEIMPNMLHMKPILFWTPCTHACLHPT